VRLAEDVRGAPYSGGCLADRQFRFVINGVLVGSFELKSAAPEPGLIALYARSALTEFLTATFDDSSVWHLES